MSKRFLILLLPLVSWAAVIPDRYIVELTDAPVAARLAGRQRQLVSRDEMEAHRASVRARQRPVQASIEALGGQVIGSVDTVANALLVRMSSQSAQQVAGMSEVRRVRAERSFRLFLDRAVVVNKVKDAWTVAGFDQAGLGIKIGLIDTGIDSSHAGFQDPSLPIPPGFPKVNAATDTAYTNNKVIVARSYATLFSSADPDLSARDRVGHGTGTAMAAGGVTNAGPLATITGVAPKAYLGSYKVFGTPGANDSASESAILKAIDDAVADGMDIINLSLGIDLPTTLDDDPEAAAIAHAANMGVIVVAAAGNDGPDLHTVGAPASSPDAITVGASSNDRLFGASAIVGSTHYVAIPGDGPQPPSPVTAPLVDVSSTQSDGLACAPFAAGSLAGKIALVLRGTCLFQDKIDNVTAGGAVGALVYTYQSQPQAFEMGVGGDTLPATMVSYSDGIAIKQQLAFTPLTATLNFTVGPAFVDPDRLADFSSRGPNVDGTIKPDMVAVGTNFYTAAQKFDPQGDLFNATGYGLAQGTSFSSPMVAGAAAVLKAARPGLLVSQYRSLLINSTSPAFAVPGVAAEIQQAGAGNLNLLAALTATAAVSPSSLGFGVGSGDVQFTRTLNLSNVGATAESFQLALAPQESFPGFVAPGSRTAEAFALSLTTPGRRPVLSLSVANATLNPGESMPVNVTFTGVSLGPGAHEGFILITGSHSGVEMRVPYWYGVPANKAQNVTVLNSLSSGRAGQLVPDGILFRVTDAAGISADTTPHATVTSGNGVVTGIVSLDSLYPGVYAVNLRLGLTAGANVFKITAGSQSQEVTIIGN